MTTEDRNHLLSVLHSGRDAFLSSIKGCANYATQPAPDRWSVLEIAEHIALVEVRLLGLIQSSPQAEGSVSGDAARESNFVTSFSSRASRAQAPEPVLPKGSMKSLDDAVAAFETARKATVAFVESGADLRAYTINHPRFGTLNGYEMALIMAAHLTRHADQVREVRAALGDN